MISVCILSLAGLLSAIIIRKDKPEFVIMIIILTGFCIALKIMGIMRGTIEEIKQWQNVLAENVVYIKLFIKLIGITYLCEFSANLCRDSGYSALGSHIELFGKISIMMAGLPMIKTMLEMLVTSSQ